MLNTVTTVHDDWDADYDDDHEHLWRLDYAVGGHEYQVQVFLIPAVPESPLDFNTDFRVTGWPVYKSARLFLERDNRLGNGERWDYACDDWVISVPVATGLLAADKALAVWFLTQYTEAVARLPNDRTFIRKCWTRAYGDVRERPAVLAKWAEVDKEPPRNPVEEHREPG